MQARAKSEMFILSFLFLLSLILGRVVQRPVGRYVAPLTVRMLLKWVPSSLPQEAHKTVKPPDGYDNQEDRHGRDEASKVAGCR